MKYIIKNLSDEKTYRETDKDSSCAKSLKYVVDAKVKKDGVKPMELKQCYALIRQAEKKGEIAITDRNIKIVCIA